MWRLIDHAVTCAICSVKTSMRTNQLMANLVAILPSRLLDQELSAILCDNYVCYSHCATHINQRIREMKSCIISRMSRGTKLLVCQSSLNICTSMTVTSFCQIRHENEHFLKEFSDNATLDLLAYICNWM